MIDPFYVICYQKNLSNEAKIQLVEFFNELHRHGHYNNIERILGELNFNRLADDIILLILRINAPVASKVPAFSLFLEKAQNKYKDDPEKMKILQGLQKE
jgi:hypothetical protein